MMARQLARLFLAASLSVGFAGPALSQSQPAAQQSHPSHPPSGQQPYAGQQTRSVTTLSAQDIAELQRGAGWGLAKPAELNGYPGPLHVLELADKLELTTDQRQRIERIFKRMQARARSAGERYVAAEAAIDHVFRSGAAHKGGSLQTRLRDAERLRTELRRVHLQAHVETTPLLTETQRLRYAELRGYGGIHPGHEHGHGHGHGRHQHNH
jgi:hypothetical protein